MHPFEFFWPGHFLKGGGRRSLLTARRYWVRATLEQVLSGNTSYRNWHFTRKRSNSDSHLTCHESSLTPSSMPQMNNTYKSKIHWVVNEAAVSLLIWELRFWQVYVCLDEHICCWSQQNVKKKLKFIIIIFIIVNGNKENVHHDDSLTILSVNEFDRNCNACVTNRIFSYEYYFKQSCS